MRRRRRAECRGVEREGRRAWTRCFPRIEPFHAINGKGRARRQTGAAPRATVAFAATRDAARTGMESPLRIRVYRSHRAWPRSGDVEVPAGFDVCAFGATLSPAGLRYGPALGAGQRTPMRRTRAGRRCGRAASRAGSTAGPSAAERTRRHCFHTGTRPGVHGAPAASAAASTLAKSTSIKVRKRSRTGPNSLAAIS